MTTLHTLGDSILDCGHYNPHGVHPAGLLVRNDDALFPEFRGNDLTARGVSVDLVHAAVDGARLPGLEAQMARGAPAPGAIVMLTIGGNDFIGGLGSADASAIDAWRDRLDALLSRLDDAHVLVGNVYDPTFGDDSRNFLPVPADVARANHRRLNDALAMLGRKHGAPVDLHRHFLENGDPSWFTMTIEPSLTGASEIRRCFLPHVLERIAGA